MCYHILVAIFIIFLWSSCNHSYDCIYCLFGCKNDDIVDLELVAIFVVVVDISLLIMVSQQIFHCRLDWVFTFAGVFYSDSGQVG